MLPSHPDLDCNWNPYPRKRCSHEHSSSPDPCAHLDNVSPITTQPVFTGRHQSLTHGALDKPPEADRIRPGPVAFETILTGFGQAPAGVTVINDPDTWSIFWQQNCSPCQLNITSHAYIRPPTPQIDFTTHTVIVASPGLEGNPGVNVKINTVIDHAHHIIIDATLTTPGNYCVWIQMVVFPEQIIIVPKTSLSLILNMNIVQAPACPI